MAHEIESTDRFGEVRSRGQRAWHGLGEELPAGLSAVQGFFRLGLGWLTEMVELVGKYTNPVTGETQEIPFPEHRGHLRLDNLTGLGVVGEGYKPVQNEQLAKFADALTGSMGGVELETAGSLRGGRRIFALVRLPKVIEVTDRDILKQYVLISNSHDGSSSFQVYPTLVRVVCRNTQRLSEIRDAHKGCAFRHTGDVGQKIQVARETLGIILNETERVEGMIMAMKAITLNQVETYSFMLDVFNATFGEVDSTSDDEAAKKAVARRDKVLAQWKANLENENQDLPGIRGTAWAAYNAITEYHDHQRGRFRPISETDSRIHSNLWGVSHRSKAIAFKAAMALA